MREPRKHSHAELFRSATLSMYPAPMEICPDLAVAPDGAFDAPEFQEPIPREHDPEWIALFINKSLAGYDVRKPSPERFASWFQSGHVVTAMEGSIITSVLGELHRHGGMPWLWKLERTLGVSIRDIARTLREGNVQAAYPCLWVNRHAWAKEAKRKGQRPALAG
ncbi:MAG: hypothetical protein OXQ89_14580 [Rhodospirillaceae bacterium]|nr:hypothetical protein [Rhodospirillaceae bacterium]MDD9998961.1 hypothetical protein [Rhodospirillaceae bacterium]MDE0360376.1 hypothetical protein [Rhodospirillaceae bacterium]